MEASVNSIKRLVIIALACTLAAGCSSKDGDDGDGNGNGDNNSTTVTPTGRALPSTDVDSAAINAGAIEETDDANVVPATKARIGSVPSSASGGHDLDRELAGELGSLEFDIDADGNLEFLGVFIADIDDTVYMYWEKHSLCHLTFTDASATFYAFSPCESVDGDTIICRYGSTTACQQCGPDSCEDCEGDDNNAIYCGAAAEAYRQSQIEPEPDMSEPDLISEDVPHTEDVPPTEDIPVSVDVPEQDIPQNEGVCEDSCMSQSGAMCCTSCGCDTSVPCYPTCGSGFLWDCELECCFNYDGRCCEGDSMCM